MRGNKQIYFKMIFICMGLLGLYSFYLSSMVMPLSSETQNFEHQLAMAHLTLEEYASEGGGTQARVAQNYFLAAQKSIESLKQQQQSLWLPSEFQPNQRALEVLAQYRIDTYTPPPVIATDEVKLDQVIDDLHARAQEQSHILKQYFEGYTDWFVRSLLIFDFLMMFLVIFIMLQFHYRQEKSEQEQRKQKTLLEHGQSLVKMGIWEYFPHNGEFQYSQGFTRILELEQNTKTLTLQDVAFMMPADDRKLLKSEMKEAFAKRGQFQILHQVLTPMGKIKVVRNRVWAFENKKDKTWSMLGSLVDITEEQQSQQRIKQLSLYHGITNLPNRRYFNEQLAQDILFCGRKRLDLALIMVDLHKFKQVNETYGHESGDLILNQVGKLLISSLRQSDLVAHFEGDQYVIILSNIQGPENAAEVAMNLIKHIQKPINHQDDEIYLDTSIGISMFPNDATEPEELLKKVKIALNDLKSQKRGDYRFYSNQMSELVKKRRFLDSSLHKAVENQEFEVYYQPQVNATTGELIGAEALVRWHHPKHGFISPVDFVPLAEETGLIRPIGEWVLQRACKQTATWREQGLKHIVMSVNFSPVQIKKGNMFEVIKDALEMAKLSGEALKVELTESVLMSNVDQTVRMLTQLNDLGVKNALDDFGTGYSSLSYLHKFPLNDLKIDRAFVTNIHQDNSIAMAIIQLTKSLNLSVIAEGVEGQNQKEELLRLGCERIQGYYYSRPLPAAEFEKCLSKGFLIPQEVM